MSKKNKNVQMGDIMRNIPKDPNKAITECLNKKGRIKCDTKKTTKIMKCFCAHHSYSKKGKLKPRLDFDGNGNARCTMCGEEVRVNPYTNEQVEKAVDTCISEEIPKDEWNLTELNELIIPIIPIEKIHAKDIEDIKNASALKQYLKEKAVMLYESKEAEFPEPEQFREIERVVLLKVIDRKWMDHIDDMTQLRQGIGLQAYGQRDPLVEYKMAGFDMFDSMISAIQEDTIRLLYHVQVQQKVEREQVAKVTGTNKDESAANAPKKRATKKVFPNEPCPCGSGKKYKQCCGKFN